MCSFAVHQAGNVDNFDLDHESFDLDLGFADLVNQLRGLREVSGVFCSALLEKIHTSLLVMDAAMTDLLTPQARPWDDGLVSCWASKGSNIPVRPCC